MFMPFVFNLHLCMAKQQTFPLNERNTQTFISPGWIPFWDIFLFCFLFCVNILEEIKGLIIITVWPEMSKRSLESWAWFLGSVEVGLCPPQCLACAVSCTGRGLRHTLSDLIHLKGGTTYPQLSTRNVWASAVTEDDTFLTFTILSLWKRENVFTVLSTSLLTL